MKEKNNKFNKLIIALIVTILVAGMIVIFTVGFNKSIIYQKGTKIEVKIDQGYQLEDIKEIAKETFPSRDMYLQKIEKLDQIVSIKVDHYTEEELENFKTKIVEKYGMNKDELQVEEVESPTTRISTLALPYLMPVILVTALTFIYIGIKNIKNKQIGKVMITLLLALVSTIGIYFSVIAIARIPISTYTMPIALVIYVATLLITVINLNKEKEIEEEQ